MPYTLKELEEIANEHYNDDGIGVVNKLKELVMTEVYAPKEDSTVVDIEDDTVAYWGSIGLYIIQKNTQIILRKEGAQNLLNYLEGKRPKVVWE